jgi:hypothetical protein
VRQDDAQQVHAERLAVRAVQATRPEVQELQ